MLVYVNVVTKAEFAKLLKVSRAAVTNATKRGTLPETDGGIDVDNAKVKAYIKKHSLGADGYGREQKKARSAKSRSKPSGQKNNNHRSSAGNGSSVPAVASTPAFGAAVEDQDDEDVLNKILAEIRWKQTQIQLNTVRIGREMGILVHRDVIAKKYAALDGELRTRILDIPKRVTPKLMAMVRSGATEQEIVEYLNGEISDGIRAAKAASKKLGPESLLS